jgi:tripartite-type tricarboxylate transporter receptor subunit TctC
MMMNRREAVERAIQFAALAVTTTFGLRAVAQSDGAVQVIVPWPAGGVVDIAARMAAPRLSEVLGRPTIVLNRPGSGGTIGSDAVAKASADGGTLLVTSSAMAMNHALRGASLPFDMSRDLVPVGGIASAPQVIVVNANSAFTSIQALVQAAKRSPGKLNYASAGNGSPAHMGTELLKIHANCFVTHIPYQGAPPALSAVMSGEVDFFMSPVPPALALIKGQRLRALAVTGPKRSAALPEVPTVAESGYPGFEATQWIGLFVPRGVALERRDRTAAAIGKVTSDSAFRKELADRGLDEVPVGSDNFRQMVKSDLERWTDVVRRSGIRAD